MTKDPTATRTYGKGASGERLVGSRLDAVADQGVVALHDRRKPRSRGNIDHIAVTPTGVYVIDTKRYSGRLERRDVGGWFRRDIRLYIGGRDRTPLAAAVADQAAAVRCALGTEFDGLPVRPALCFVDIDASLLLKPFELDGVLVTWPRALQKTVSRTGPIAAETIEAAVHHLGRHFPPA
ncbi:nuclease-related domain-containing protein [Rhabdothermincola salaria]|uniref:nuclease-related domain-containing protein n=1 Tax=Rhabdothermincola salaria TaxID=2903142 RepID=UPI001E5D4837|nr:NERD domain-containing protein [Rhabdothermincola salaria]